jgi:4-amino-4-deoxychorismate lyase
MTAWKSACLVNGKTSAVLDVSDRGLHYGDGVFETMAVANGVVLLWEQHLRRLQRGCGRLGIPVPEPDQLHRESMQLTAGVERGVLKLMVTRGAGARGYRYREAVPPTRVLQLHPWPEHPPRARRDGAVVGLCRTRLSRQPLLAGIKHLNRLEQVLARSEWTDEWHEAVMLDERGNAIEATASNLFIVRGGAVLTPVLDECGVAGVLREMIITSGPALQLDVRESRLAPADLEAADELFLTNSIIGLWPVGVYNGKRRGVGPVSRRLQEHLCEQNWAIMD